MISLIVVLAILISIALGYKTKINTGFFAMGFAYIIGCFVLNLKASQVIAMWPISIFFVIFSVSLFYNFALVNGTLEKLSLHILYKCRKMPKLLPFVIFFAAVLISGLGAGYFTVMVFLAPLTLLLCKETGMSTMVGSIILSYGSLAGANFMTSGCGIVFKSFIESAGFKDLSFVYTAYIFIITMIVPILLILAFVIFSKNLRNMGKTLDIKKPEPFDKNQKINLYLIIAMVLIVLVPPVLHLVIPKNAVITFINSKMDVGLVSIIFSIIVLMLKIADQKAAIAKVPWSTLIMICGVGMLISVAIKAGTIKLLASWISGNLPAFAVPIVLSIVGGLMAAISSTLGVVVPALFPAVPSIAQATGISPAILFICIVIGAQSASISPFSSGGSIVLGSCSDEEERNKLFPRLLFIAAPMCMGIATVVSIIISLVTTIK
ncbi:di/tricarboxylate transporter [Clostridium algifaecis]|uniref:Di/tricarboxylate transporter n=1 Tax=Clostridium algifaecis TaxID=1472040 RepID=A0ABS4KSN8_9CLOT|nr:SLC13 family permease [Clostridium algifaecis]MBP2033059.1 di/tricarboxylate transporter [Clostridium algifaecis]